MTHVLGLSETNQDLLAQFMGHDIRIHRKFYRLPDNMLDGVGEDVKSATPHQYWKDLYIQRERLR